MRGQSVTNQPQLILSAGDTDDIIDDANEEFEPDALSGTYNIVNYIMQHFCIFSCTQILA